MMILLVPSILYYYSEMSLNLSVHAQRRGELSGRKGKEIMASVVGLPSLFQETEPYPSRLTTESGAGITEPSSREKFEGHCRNMA